MCANTFCESLVKICVKCRLFFSDIGQCFRTVQTKSLENKKSMLCNYPWQCVLIRGTIYERLVHTQGFRFRHNIHFAGDTEF